MTAPFASLDDVEAILQRPLTDAEAPAAQLLLEWTSDEISTEIGQQIVSAQRTVKLAGTWSTSLELPGRPVTSVTAVSLNDVVMAAGGWWWDGRRSLRRGFLADDHGDDEWPAAQGARRWESLHWGGPQSTVTVTYTYGYVTAPGNIKALCVQVALRSLTNPAQVRSEQLGSYAVTYTVPGTGQVFGQMLTDIERQRLRRKYTRTAGTITASRA